MAVCRRRTVSSFWVFAIEVILMDFGGMVVRMKAPDGGSAHRHERVKTSVVAVIRTYNSSVLLKLVQMRSPEQPVFHEDILHLGLHLSS